MILAAVPSSILVACAVLANSGATLFLRKMAHLSPSLSPRFPFMATEPLLLGGGALFFYMGAFLLYALVLQRLPVSLAYLVITSLTQILLLSYAVAFLQEQLSLTAWAGVGLTLLGLTLIFLPAGR